MKIIRGILVAFGAISIFVGAFIIFNTLSITVAQRIRELAMLRTVGAIAASDHALGDRRGRGDGHDRDDRRHRRSASRIAKGLQAVMSAAGLDLPKVGTVFEARTAIVAAIVGIGVTVARLDRARRCAPRASSRSPRCAKAPSCR